MQSLIIRGKASEARSLFEGKGFDDWEYDVSFLSRLGKSLKTGIADGISFRHWVKVLSRRFMKVPAISGRLTSRPSEGSP